jgi:hypothetical protein
MWQTTEARCGARSPPADPPGSPFQSLQPVRRWTFAGLQNKSFTASRRHAPVVGAWRPGVNQQGSNTHRTPLIVIVP